MLERSSISGKCAVDESDTMMTMLVIIAVIIVIIILTPEML